MRLTDFWPAQRHQLADGIQFHGARAKGNHRLREGQVPPAQLCHVAHNQGFLTLISIIATYRLISVEDLLAEVLCGSGDRSGGLLRLEVLQEGLSVLRGVGVGVEAVGQLDEVLDCGGLIEADAHRRVSVPQV